MEKRSYLRNDCTGVGRPWYQAVLLFCRFAPLWVFLLCGFVLLLFIMCEFEIVLKYNNNIKQKAYTKVGLYTKTKIEWQEKS